jgi:adenylate cyclase
MMMKLQATPVTIPAEATSALTDWPELRRAHRVIVVVDVVESVRLMQADEADVIDRWRRFVNEVRTQLLPKHGGRLVKSLGDGLLLEFETVPAATACALELQHRIVPFNLGRRRESTMALRVGINCSDIVVDDLDIYGSGVNLTARIATLAQPGEVVVTAEVRDELVDGLDAQLDDLGDCFLKNLSEPVRVYRVAAAQRAALGHEQRTPLAELRPTIAVLPFRAPTSDAIAQALGDAIADEVISGLSKSSELSVISRLSTLVFSHREAGLEEISTSLGAGYVLSGKVLLDGQRLRLSVELAEHATKSVLWADSLLGDVRDVFDSDQELANAVIAKVGNCILQNEVRHASTQPLPTLRSYSLMLGAITLMHRSARADFDRAGALLEHLIDRERGHSRPHAWLANWYALRVTQSQSGSVQDDTLRALDSAKRALDRDSGSSLALAIDGALQMNLVKDFVTAEHRFDLALEHNPNESLAWLFKGVMHAFRGEGQAAENAGDRALALTPLDPMRHYYDSLAATAALGAANYTRAEQLAQRSMRANRAHPSTYRALAIAQAMQGQTEAARNTVDGLLQLSPNYRVSDFKVLSGFSAGPLRDVFSEALTSAGLPA